MAEEIEVKFVDIDPDEVRRKLTRLGGKRVLDILYRKMFFDYPDLRFDKSNQWIRLRDEGDRVTMAYKKLEPGKKIEEVEVEVSDFDGAAELFGKLGFVQSYYMENKRERYKLNGVEFDIDTYPLIGSYLEIEASSHGDLESAIEWLSLDPKKKLIGSVNDVYSLKGIDLSQFSVLTFGRQVKR
ncbi:hypothetical protein A2899_02565 [Candidatus Amesbacteria bacterium RIFCSPLOWO2_01_FULL_49_25]|uniref:CYTH domain-containing protein n=1 Tax=Candidatus Amesbacteria bacterium RIFCSPHIGHO2_01_FULL_48_32b TaxID=1797253 RepID=A0A1F4YFE3_9BACT|nr:MAG: hypothetical protein A2876_01335 [Candidatus Amesbacteria bacterium RIFCSPHIGHO2_01_FULL_48_32b]OGD08616.1 MAG: hypothetical protein A2899_02565 [Candidatus Amesbacteria bacterium RIFCSPLOWO2_01_FULL_49_25]